jgi:sugar fermentation stimulation protein A
MPNRIVAEALQAGRIPAFAGFRELRREVPYGDNSRIDLLLTESDGRPCYVEVKSTTLVQGDVAYFPDAVTERGRKHLRELARLARKGVRAVQFFFLSRNDAQRLQPADTIDREYGKALRRAVRAGVEVHAWSATVKRDELTLDRELQFELPPLPRAAAKRRRKAGTRTK